MKLSANEEYGLRCLVRIGYAGEGASVTIPEISLAEGFSEAYAAKILRVLRKGGFVKAARGKEGGYTLARSADQIVIADVMDVPGRAAVRKLLLRAATPGRRRSVPARWIARCVRCGAPCRWRWIMCCARPRCAIFSRTRRR